MVDPVDVLLSYPLLYWKLLLQFALPPGAVTFREANKATPSPAFGFKVVLLSLFDPFTTPSFPSR